MKEANWLTGLQTHLTADNAHKALNAGCEFLRNNPVAADLAPQSVMAGCSMYQNYRGTRPCEESCHAAPRESPAIQEKEAKR